MTFKGPIQPKLFYGFMILHSCGPLLSRPCSARPSPPLGLVSRTGGMEDVAVCSTASVHCYPHEECQVENQAARSRQTELHRGEGRPEPLKKRNCSAAHQPCTLPGSKLSM